MQDRDSAYKPCLAQRGNQEMLVEEAVTSIYWSDDRRRYSEVEDPSKWPTNCSSTIMYTGAQRTFATLKQWPQNDCLEEANHRIKSWLLRRKEKGLKIRHINPMLFQRQPPALSLRESEIALQSAGTHVNFHCRATDAPQKPGI